MSVCACMHAGMRTYVCMSVGHKCVKDPTLLLSAYPLEAGSP